MPSTTQPSDDNSALIGGVVGGVVALLIVVGVIAFIISRNRRFKNESAESSPDAPVSNYGKIVVQAEYESFATNSDTGYEVGNIKDPWHCVRWNLRALKHRVVIDPRNFCVCKL
jgi:hypothetical protein